MPEPIDHPSRPDVHYLGRVDYLPTYEAMQAVTASRTTSFSYKNGQRPAQNMRDQLWICEHPPVFTQGLAGKPEHLLLPADIPVVQTNRGGQVTYHGPGQVVAYPLIDLQRAGYFVKEYVFKIEESVIKTLLHFGVTGHRVRGAPGIYVRMDDPGSHARLDVSESDLKLRAGMDREIKWGQTPFNPAAWHIGKIAALGIKVSRHCTYHGVALNVAMDLEPFSRINPCGYAGLATTDLAQLGVQVRWDDVAPVLAEKLCTYLTT